MRDVLETSHPFAAGASRVDPRQLLQPDTELLSPATQIVGDADAYLGTAARDIGRRVSDEQLELFVVCQPAEALLQQFARLTPDFIAIHDLGTTLSARLLAAVAKAASCKMQRLVIRRQGHGTALATLPFAELPLPAGRTLRLYTTDVDSDTRSRQQLARVLLAHSRLAVLLVGEQPAHVLESNLLPLREAIHAGPWPNRELLLVPLGHTPALAEQAPLLIGASGLTAHITPQVTKATDAWTFIAGAWNRPHPARAPAPADSRAAAGAVPTADPLQARAATAGLAGERPSPTPAFVTAYATTQPLELTPTPRPQPPVATPQPQSPHPGQLWSDYVQRCAAIKGVTEACVFDVELQRPLAHRGAPHTADRLAAKGAMLLGVLADTAAALALGAAPPDAVVTLAEHFLLLRPMPGQPKVALHLVIARDHGNLGVVRAALHQIDQALLAPAG